MSTVTATYTDAQGNPASGTVYLSPAARAGVGEPPDIVTEKRVWADLDEQGRISIDVIPSDDPGWLIDGQMPYLVEERLMGLPFRSYWIGVPDAGVDLSAVQHADPDVAPMPVPGPQGPPGIQGPEGPQGQPGQDGADGQDFTPTDADARYVNATGDTMTGPLIIPAPTAAQHVPRLARTPNPATGDLGLPGYAGSDTGARAIGSLFVNGWVDRAVDGLRSTLSRHGNLVVMRLIMDESTSCTSGTVVTLPAGFRPVSYEYGIWTLTNNGTLPERRLMVTTSGVVSSNSAAGEGARFVGVATFVTGDPWPISLPGTQVTPPASWT